MTIVAPFVRHSLERSVSAESLFTLNRPLLSIVTLMLLVSAVLGSWEGLPRSVALVGLGEIPLTIGNLIYVLAVQVRVEVVERTLLVTVGQETLADVRADEAAAGDEDPNGSQTYAHAVAEAAAGSAVRRAAWVEHRGVAAIVARTRRATAARCSGRVAATRRSR